MRLSACVITCFNHRRYFTVISVSNFIACQGMETVCLDLLVRVVWECMCCLCEFVCVMRVFVCLFMWLYSCEFMCVRGCVVVCVCVCACLYVCVFVGVWVISVSI